ncbi:hypothetical protein QX776_18665 [Alteromonadaceae bacterium BrNp21-10]|nr:hypothetical protein [Alteromonadaceae bacterium BrNp21-10]
MKKFFIIAMEVAILYLVLRSTFVQYLFKDIHDDLSDWMTDIAQIPHREALDTLRERMVLETNQFTDQQRDYFNKITYSTDQVERFYKLYCVQKDKNPFIYGATLNKFCKEISLLESKF